MSRGTYLAFRTYNDILGVCCSRTAITAGVANLAQAEDAGRKKRSRELGARFSREH